MAYLVHLPGGIYTEYWSRDRNDQPNRLLLWGRGGCTYSLMLSILDKDGGPPFVQIQSTASRDYPENIRKMLRPVTKDLTIPVDKPTLQATIDELLNDVRSQVPLLNLPNSGIFQSVVTFPI